MPDAPPVPEAPPCRRRLPESAPPADAQLPASSHVFPEPQPAAPNTNSEETKNPEALTHRHPLHPSLELTVQRQTRAGAGRTLGRRAPRTSFRLSATRNTLLPSPPRTPPHRRIPPSQPFASSPLVQRILNAHAQSIARDSRCTGSCRTLRFRLGQRVTRVLIRRARPQRIPNPDPEPDRGQRSAGDEHPGRRSTLRLGCSPPGACPPPLLAAPAPPPPAAAAPPPAPPLSAFSVNVTARSLPAVAVSASVASWNPRARAASRCSPASTYTGAGSGARPTDVPSSSTSAPSSLAVTVSSATWLLRFLEQRLHRLLLLSLRRRRRERPEREAQVLCCRRPFPELQLRLTQQRGNIVALLELPGFRQRGVGLVEVVPHDGLAALVEQQSPPARHRRRRRGTRAETRQQWRHSAGRDRRRICMIKGRDVGDRSPAALKPQEVDSASAVAPACDEAGAGRTAGARGFGDGRRRGGALGAAGAGAHGCWRRNRWGSAALGFGAAGAPPQARPSRRGARARRSVLG